MLLLYRHREAQRSPQRRVNIMKTIRMQAVEKFVKLATDFLEEAKEKMLTASDVQKTENFISECYDEIQNNVMKSYFGDFYYDHVGDGSELGKTYEDLSDLRCEFTETHFELVVNEE